MGTWEVNDPAGWMEFTFRPDGRYIAKAGTGGVPKEVERGRYRLGTGKLTLAPYPNLGEPRGFETDLYDGTLLLIGDPYRMVVARKVAGSESTVSAATTDPEALTGSRGPLVGSWTVQLERLRGRARLPPRRAVPAGALPARQTVARLRSCTQWIFCPAPWSWTPV